MDKEKLIKLYESRGYLKEKTEAALKTVEALEEYLHLTGKTFDSSTAHDIKEYISVLKNTGSLDLDKTLAFARYFYLINNHDVYIYFTKLTGGLGVIENIKKRAELYAGKDTADKIFEGYNLPALGTSPDKMPEYTKELDLRLKENLSRELYEKVLAGNNHGIPEEAFDEEKTLYESSESLEAYLKGRHKRKVAELQKYCDENAIWFEQEITQPVVDFVNSNQEILSAVKKDNKLYITKIPYDTVGYLNAKTDAEKNYYACHCPFARESILYEDKNVSGSWCYCSAGFAKFPFEKILGRELKVKVLKTALDGDGLCRFEIDLD